MSLDEECPVDLSDLFSPSGSLSLVTPLTLELHLIAARFRGQRRDEKTGLFTGPAEEDGSRQDGTPVTHSAVPLSNQQEPLEEDVGAVVVPGETPSAGSSGAERSPAKWFIADDPETDVRYISIQVRMHNSSYAYISSHSPSLISSRDVRHLLAPFLVMHFPHTLNSLVHCVLYPGD